MKKHIGLLAIIVVVIVVTIVLWSNQGEPPAQGSKTSILNDTIDEVPHEVAVPGNRRELPDSPDAELLAIGLPVAVEDVPPPLPSDWISLEDLSHENLDQYIDQKIERGLEGDLRYADSLHNARDACENVPKTGEQLETRLKKVELTLQHYPDATEEQLMGLAKIRDFGKLFRDPGRNRDYQGAWYSACMKAEKRMTHLRDELARKARAGDAMARYLYAIWPPELSAADDPAIERMIWETTAWEFSQMNIDEGEALGALAFAASYLHGLFTPQDSNMGTGMAQAALMCGARIEWAEQQVMMGYAGNQYLESPVEQDIVRRIALATAGRICQYKM